MTDQVTGEQLYNEVCEAAAKSGRRLASFVAPLFNGNSWKIEQMRIAHAPTQITIDRVRALIAGEPLPPTRADAYVRDERAMGLSRAEAEARGIPPSQRSILEGGTLERQAAAKERTAWLLEVSERAKTTRRPGQTIADRARELRQEIHA